MSFPVSAVPGDLTSQPSHQPLTKSELDEALRALATPFDLQVLEWRITEWSDDRRRGLMMPYADPARMDG